MRKMLLLTLSVALSTSVAAESSELAKLPLYEPGAPPAIVDADSCRGEIQDLTSEETKRLMVDRELQPAGPVRLLPSTYVRTTSAEYDDDLQLAGEVQLEEVTRIRRTARSYTYRGANGLVRSVDVNCSLSCSGISCSSSGCTPAEAGNCTAHTCINAIGTPPCTGTCTKTSSSRPTPDNVH